MMQIVIQRLERLEETICQHKAHLDGHQYEELDLSTSFNKIRPVNQANCKHRVLVSYQLNLLSCKNMYLFG